MEPTHENKESRTPPDRNRQYTMVELAHRLLRQTKNAKISWLPIDDAGEQVIYTAPKSSAVVELRGINEEGAREIRLTLVSSRDTRIDSLTTQWHRSESGEMVASAWNDVLDELYEAARDVPVSATETFQDMFSSTDTMRDQLHHLIDIQTQFPNVTVQVLPFAATTPIGTGGSFTVLSFPQPANLGVVHIDNLVGGSFLETPQQVQQYRMAFEEIATGALPEESSIQLIEESITQLQSSGCDDPVRCRR
jgi:hypothetical protein